MLLYHIFMKVLSFGQLLRLYRQRARHPQLGALTQRKLLYMFDQAGFYYPEHTISSWERDRSTIYKDDRRTLITLIEILCVCGGINSLNEANALLEAGNYRSLTKEEAKVVNLESSFEDSLLKVINFGTTNSKKLLEMDFLVRNGDTGEIFAVDHRSVISAVTQQVILQLDLPYSALVKGKDEELLRNLSPREKEIFNFVTSDKGFSLSNREIAEVLYISPSTLKNYLRKIYNKLGVKNRRELLMLKAELAKRNTG